MAKKKNEQHNPWEHAKSLLSELENALTKYLACIRNPPVSKAKVHCKHVGCSACYVTVEAIRKHEAKPHFECSCGRCFTRRGLNTHLAQLRSLGLPHLTDENAISETFGESLVELKKLILGNCPKR